MKSGRKKSLTAPIIKYDFSYSVNSKTIIFPFLLRQKIYRKKLIHWLFSKICCFNGKVFDEAKNILSFDKGGGKVKGEGRIVVLKSVVFY